ncbi:MAG: c-type cytochrome [Gammaproteobacteria bacterium]|nr:c-type cytochrome [Gammaproteobacteria bacterium]
MRGALLILLLFAGQGAIGDASLYFACGACHGRNGEGNEAFDAPAIAGMDPVHFSTQLRNFRSGVRGRSLEDLYGRQMGLIAAVLEDQDIPRLAAYVANLPREKPLRTMPVPEADAESLYAPCAACHGANGEGVDAVGGPPLAWLDDWYLLRQLRNYRSGTRGADSRNRPGVQMRDALANYSDAQFRQLAPYIAALPSRAPDA